MFSSSFVPVYSLLGGEVCSLQPNTPSPVFFLVPKFEASFPSETLANFFFLPELCVLFAAFMIIFFRVKDRGFRNVAPCILV
jgi:hypothetical protein